MPSSPAASHTRSAILPDTALARNRIRQPPSDPANWQASAEYLRGIELFNHGYYWESHEVWESLWHAAGRTGPIADFLKGLIALAAAGVKVREGKAAGVGVSRAPRWATVSPSG